MNLTNLAAKAQHSSFYRWLLSRGLNTMVPFNGPHRFRVEEIDDRSLKVSLPYRKKNLNHLKGIHACALATLAEVSSGFLLISLLDPKKYRLILQRLEMDYLYQAKTAVSASFSIQKDWLQKEVIATLESEGIVLLQPEIKIYDTNGNHVATGKAHWQIKDWAAVKTKV